MTETSTTVARKRAEIKPLPSRELLMEFLAYDPLTGIFTWLKPPANRVSKGSRAGAVIAKGHRTIQIQGVGYYAHRLAWFIHYGEDPPYEIDHEDGHADHNWIANLREATRAQNQWNTGAKKNSRSGQKHVSWEKRRGRWRVAFWRTVKGEYVCLHHSRHAELADAIRTRDAVAKQLHGEFAFQT